MIRKPNFRRMPLFRSTQRASVDAWTVRRVVDGDTLVLENKERVRLIGVDNPETKPMPPPHVLQAAYPNGVGEASPPWR